MCFYYKLLVRQTAVGQQLKLARQVLTGLPLLLLIQQIVFGHGRRRTHLEQLLAQQEQYNLLFEVRYGRN